MAKKKLNKAAVKEWATSQGVEIMNYAPLTGKFDTWVTLNPYFRVEIHPDITVLEVSQSPHINNIMVMHCEVNPEEEEE